MPQKLSVDLKYLPSVLNIVSVKRSNVVRELRVAHVYLKKNMRNPSRPAPFNLPTICSHNPLTLNVFIRTAFRNTRRLSTSTLCQGWNDLSTARKDYLPSTLFVGRLLLIFSTIRVKMTVDNIYKWLAFLQGFDT